MNWGSWDIFFTMGGYAFYVWGSYGVTAMLIVVEVFLLKQRKRAAQRGLVRALASRNGSAQ
jgi:heme exporter protein D